MKYPTGQNITYTAVAKTDGYVSGDHSYLWQFDDSTTATTASTSKAWSTSATHRATVTATNVITGGTDSAFVDVVVKSLGNWTGNGTLGDTTRDWQDITYGNGMYVMVAVFGSNGVAVARSSDGISWQEATFTASGFSTIVQAKIAFGNGTFCMVVRGTAQYTAYYSYDAITWTQSSIASKQWRGIAYGNGKFVAVSYLNGTTGQFSSSTDGITFTPVNSPADRQWADITYANGLFVAIATATTSIAYSADGASWSTAVAPASRNWNRIVGGNGIFLANSNITTSGQQFMKSTNGVDWSLAGPSATLSLNAIGYGDGLFVTLASGTGTAAYSSTDCTTWTLVSRPTSINPFHITHGGDRFVACNYGSGGGSMSLYTDW